MPAVSNMPSATNESVPSIVAEASSTATTSALEPGAVDSRNRPSRRRVGPVTQRRNVVAEPTVVTRGPVMERTENRRAVDHPASPSTATATKSAAIIASTTGVPVSRAIAPAPNHAATNAGAPRDRPIGRVRVVPATLRPWVA